MNCVFHKSHRKTQGETKALIRYNIKSCLEQVGCKDVTCFHLAHIRVQGHFTVETVTKLQTTYNRRIYLTYSMAE